MKLGTNTQNDDVLSPDHATLFKENRNVSGCVFGSGHFGKNPPESVWCCAVDNTSLVLQRPQTNLQQIH